MNCSNPRTPLELSDPFQIHRATGPEHMLRHIYEGSALCQAPLAHRICESWKASGHCGYFLYFPNDTTKAQAGLRNWLDRGHPSTQGQRWDWNPRTGHAGPHNHFPEFTVLPLNRSPHKSIPSYLIWIRKLEFPAISGPADKRLTGFISE